MRFKEFNIPVQELIQPELQDNKGFERKEYDELGFEWTAFSKGNNELVIEVKTSQGETIAQAIFRNTEDPDNLNSDDTWVDKKYRRMGIATKMYNWAQSLGNTINPSKFRSSAGKKFWRSRISENHTKPSYQQMHQGYVISIYPRGFTIHKDNELVLEKERFVGSIVDENDIKAARMAVERIAQARALKRRQLAELEFMGSTCTKDCSGHAAGYKWSLDHNGATPNSHSSSFNSGAKIALDKKKARPQGGGKMPQYVSQTPDAIRKREARLQAQQAQKTTVGDTSQSS